MRTYKQINRCTKRRLYVFFSFDCKLGQLIANCLLFLRVMVFLRTLKKTFSLIKTFDIFKEPTENAYAVIDTGYLLLTASYKLFNKKESILLIKLRYLCYLRSACKASIHLASLLPFEFAAKQHSMKVYF